MAAMIRTLIRPTGSDLRLPACPRALRSLVFLLFAVMPPLAPAQEDPPLQVDVRMPVRGNRGLGTSFRRQLQGGLATVSGRVLNQPGGETALVELQFDYRVDADFALDEIIARIVVSIQDAAGNEFSNVTIDPNTIHLNPNRVPLSYSATLYTVPKRGQSGYFVRVQVFGNYE